MTDRSSNEKIPELPSELRRAARISTSGYWAGILLEAADEIERLRSSSETNEQPYCAHTTLRRAAGPLYHCNGCTRQFVIPAADSARETFANVWLSIDSFSGDERGDYMFWVVPKTAEETYTNTDGQPILAKHNGRRHIGKWRCWGSLEKATHWRHLPEEPSSKTNEPNFADDYDSMTEHESKTNCEGSEK